MQKKILEFTNILRKSGIRVSTAEAIDAFQALDELSIDDREIFRDALRTTMVKRGEEVPTYDELFDLYWSGFYDNLRETFGERRGVARAASASISRSCSSGSRSRSRACRGIPASSRSWRGRCSRPTSPCSSS